MKTYYVYIEASAKNGTLYIGVTNNLARRHFEHTTAQSDSFTKKYHVNKLVYYEECHDIQAAIAREKQLKQWRRQWKINQIESVNPLWKDLAKKYKLIES